MDGDSLVESIVSGLREKSRQSFMDGLWKFIIISHEAEKVGGLRRGTKSVTVVKP